MSTSNPSGKRPNNGNSKGPVIFRRYRTLPNGKVLDAFDYGLKAWPIYIGKPKGK